MFGVAAVEISIGDLPFTLEFIRLAEHILGKVDSPREAHPRRERQNKRSRAACHVERQVRWLAARRV